MRIDTPPLVNGRCFLCWDGTDAEYALNIDNDSTIINVQLCAEHLMELTEMLDEIQRKAPQ